MSDSKPTTTPETPHTTPTTPEATPTTPEATPTTTHTTPTIPHHDDETLQDGFHPVVTDVSDTTHDFFVESPARVFGYFARVGKLIGTGMAKGSRYVAYSSDVGEAFRPVVDKRFVKGGYAVAGAYVLADVAYNGMEAQKKGQDVARAVAHTFTFQMLASLIVPSVIIHGQVHMAHKAFHHIGRYQRWGPVAAGLLLIPVLPYVVDEPFEHLVDYTFDKFWPVQVPDHVKQE